ncbi:nuclear transport factor 2 family protein [Tumidithrix elongata RA019]|uniref:Nuclear transport factor 2 family protein n=1 Tax=Tumidithrix elongata BACA0141 TaxID=2716417 RepID=A0AAW9PW83_9CYAN|nr:nuclear transport factor 2 family protein [Tumidithrix elongata RA019]
MESTIKQQILEAEETLRQAMIRSDVEALNELISSELLFTDFLGQLVTKQQDLDAHASGAIKIDDIALTELQVLPVQETVAVVSVRVYITGSYNGNPASGNFRFTRVWSRSPQGTWHIIAGHCGTIA